MGRCDCSALLASFLANFLANFLVGLAVFCASPGYAGVQALSPLDQSKQLTMPQSAEALCKKLYQVPSAKAFSACHAALEADDGKASNHQRMGQLHFRNRHYRKASDHFSRALALAEKWSSNADMALAFNGLGRVHRAKGRTDAAQRYFRQSLDHCKADAKCIAGNHDAIGYLALKRGRYSEAERHFRLCHRQASSISNRKLMASCQYGLATAQFQSGLYRQAQGLCRQVLQLYQQNGNKKGMASALGCLTSSAKALKAPKSEWCQYQKERAALYLQVGDLKRSILLRTDLDNNNCP